MPSASASACWVSLRSSRSRFSRTPMNVFFMVSSVGDAFANFADSQNTLHKTPHFQWFTYLILCGYCGVEKPIGASTLEHAGNHIGSGRGPLPGSGVAGASQSLRHALRRQHAANHGGKAAFVCASRHARCAVVMAKADSIEFARPIRIGAIIDIRANVVFQGQSSMTVVVEIVAEDPAGQRGTPSV